MKKILTIFGSTTGNTLEMAEIIGRRLAKAGIETHLKDVTDAVPEDLTAGYALVLLGCPAYGDNEIELQEDFEDFYGQMGDIDLEGRQFAVFAPGDSSYEHFCGSVDMLEAKIEELGGDLVSYGLRIDGDPRSAEEQIEEWADSIAELLI